MRISKADVEFYHADRVMKQARLLAGCDISQWEQLSFRKKQRYLDQAVDAVQRFLSKRFPTGIPEVLVDEKDK